VSAIERLLRLLVGSRAPHITRASPIGDVVEALRAVKDTALAYRDEGLHDEIVAALELWDAEQRDHRAEAKLCALIDEYMAWVQMIETGRNAAGEPVQVDGRIVVQLRPALLADIGRAAVAAHVDKTLRATVSPQLVELSGDPC
jgi:hypothetical protein